MNHRSLERFPIILIASSLLAASVAAQQPETAPTQPAPTPSEVKPADTAAPTADPAAAVTPPATEAPAEPPKKRKSEETITVTGSRIRRKDLNSQAPVTIVGKEQIANSGRANLGDFLQAMPEQGNATNTTVNNGGSGATRLSLRSLGANRTLILVNGRRWVPGGLGADDSVDLNSIPTAAIERVEVLKDGASAVYGSDAIAGVVNIITKKRYDGADFNVYAGTSQRGDGVTYSVDGTGGVTGDRGSVLFSAGWFQQYPVFAGDRAYSTPQTFFHGAPGGTGYLQSGSGTIPEGRTILIRSQIGRTDPAASSLYNQLVTMYPTANSFMTDPTAPLGWRPYRGPALATANPPGDGYNYAPINYLSTPQTRLQLFTTGDVKFGSNARMYFEGAFLQRNSAQQLAPEPLVLDGLGLKVSKDNVYNPFGVDLAVRRRLSEFGPRTFSQDLNNFRIVVGLDGQLPEEAGVLSGWSWDVSFNYGRFQGVTNTVGTLRTTRIGAAVGPSFYDSMGVARCGTPGNVIDGCVPLNLFGGEGTITPEQVTGVGFDGTTRLNNSIAAVQGNFGGELFRLFASKPVGLAFGYEYRAVSGAQTPDPITAADENSGGGAQPTAGGFYSNEVYGELSIPIVSDLPFFHELEVTGAIRYNHYSTYGGTTTFKGGGAWRPLQGFAIRGTASNAFRAPSVSDLYTGAAAGFPGASDPCADAATAPANCGAAAGNGDTSTQLRTISGGNKDLMPETAITFTGGVVIEPGLLAKLDVIKRLSLTVDYWQINMSEAIQTLSAGGLLAGCYNANPNEEYCNQIERDPTSQYILNIRNFPLNVGKKKVEGLDFGFRFGIPTPVGEFSLFSNTTYMMTSDEIVGSGPTQVFKAYVGTYDDTIATPRIRNLSQLTWSYSGVSAGLNGRFVGSYKECGDQDGQGFFTGPGNCYDDATYQKTISPFFSLDLFLAYRFNWVVGKTQAMVGMNNVFDASPPYIANAFANNTDPTIGYDMLGRYFYLRLSHAL